jgi:hypothetical protein
MKHTMHVYSVYLMSLELCSVCSLLIQYEATLLAVQTAAQHSYVHVIMVMHIAL